MILIDENHLRPSRKTRSSKEDPRLGSMRSDTKAPAGLLPPGLCQWSDWCSEGREVITEVVEQIRLRFGWFERLVVAAQLAGIVTFERRSEFIEELEYLGDVLIGELGRVYEPE